MGGDGLRNDRRSATTRASFFYPPKTGSCPSSSNDVMQQKVKKEDGHDCPIMWLVAVLALCVLSLAPITDAVVRPDRTLHHLVHAHRHALDHTFYRKWPWMVRFEFHKMDRRCGGALIGSNLVLTAAHCVARVRSVVMNAR